MLLETNILALFSAKIPRLGVLLILWFITPSLGLDFEDLPWEIEADFDLGLISYHEKIWLLEWANSPLLYCEQLLLYYPELDCNQETSRPSKNDTIAANSSGKFQLGVQDQEIASKLFWQHQNQSAKQKLYLYVKDDLESHTAQLQKASYHRSSKDLEATLGHLNSSSILPHFYLRPYSQARHTPELLWQNDDYLQGIHLRQTQDYYLNIGSSHHIPGQDYSWLGYQHPMGGVQIHHLNQSLALDSNRSQHSYYLHLNLQIQSLTLMWSPNYHGFKSSYQYDYGRSSFFYIKTQDLDPYIRLPYYGLDQRAGIHYFWDHQVRLGFVRLSNHFQETRLEGEISSSTHYLRNQITGALTIWDLSYINRLSSSSQLSHSLSLQNRIALQDFYFVKSQVQFPNRRLDFMFKTLEESQSQSIYLTWQPSTSRESHWKIKQSLAQDGGRSLEAQFQVRLFGEFYTDSYFLKLLATQKF